MVQAYKFFVLALCICSAATAEVSMEKVEYGGWPNCIRLTNGSIELIATTDVGPRIIRLAFVDGGNLFKEYESMMGATGGEEWRIYGGHRFWHAPEASPRTYAPDNTPIDFTWDGSTLVLKQPTEPATGIQKEMEVTLSPTEDRVTLLHRHTNRNLWPVTLAPWALTVMVQGGRAIFPQEAYGPHPEFLLPARPLVLWRYTDMTDPRWTWGSRYIQLRQDPDQSAPQKVGLLNKQGWAAYALGGNVFIKRYACAEDASYPDHGCNTETFTNADMLEVESLGPLAELPPDGGTVEHAERWYLFRAELGTGEDELDTSLMPLVKRTE